MNYCDYLFQTKTAWLKNTALVDVDSEKSWTYQELQHQVRVFAGRLIHCGIEPGDVVATHLYNSAEAVIAHLGIQYVGAVSCLLDPLITAQGLEYYLRDSAAKALLTHLDPTLVKPYSPKELEIFDSSQIQDMIQNSGKSPSPPAPTAMDENRVAAIFYTSGTTSQPKGVLLAPRSFRAHVDIFIRGCYEYEPSDRLLCFVPFSHGYGSKSIFLPGIKSGATFLIMRSFHPLKVVDAIQKYKITHIFGVPAHYQQLLRRAEFVDPLKSLKAAFSAAALLKLETAREWVKKIGFYLDEGYGLIETCTGVAFRRTSLPIKLGHVGSYSADLVDIEVVDENGDRVAHGERGEIVVRGKSVMLGYLNKPEETNSALSDGWFRTGDLGYKTEDQQLILTGRLKDVINIAGIKVAPFEVESELNEHPDVNESAVLGVEDDTYGEVVVAFVKLNQSAQKDERALMQFLQRKLMSFQVPKSITFIDHFPRNAMGKIDKNVLRTKIADGISKIERK